MMVYTSFQMIGFWAAGQPEGGSSSVVWVTLPPLMLIFWEGDHSPVAAWREAKILEILHEENATGVGGDDTMDMVLDSTH